MARRFVRGGVFALENGAWTQLVGGSVVSDDRVIKSATGGRITLVRGAEAIETMTMTTIGWSRSWSLR